MTAVQTGRRRYWNAVGNKIIVLVNFVDKVLLPLSVFQYGAAFSDRSDAFNLVQRMRLNEHEFLTIVDGVLVCTGHAAGCYVDWSIPRTGVLLDLIVMARSRICRTFA